MKRYDSANGTLCIDEASGALTSLSFNDRNLSTAPTPLVTLGLRQSDGEAICLDSTDLSFAGETEQGYEYISNEYGLRVYLSLREKDGGIDWRIKVKNIGDILIEWAEIGTVILQSLVQNGGIGSILYPYNEGALVDDALRREQSWFPPCEPSYPSRGTFQ